MEANGGQVRVESLPGQGSSFVVVAAAAPGGPGVSAARRVLVCDDEPQILRALRVVLRDAGFDVLPAATAQEALDRAAVQAPDAAIIDLVLPDGDGIEVCKSLREWSRMPIIVLSAIGDEEEKVRALEAGADDYVVEAVRAARAGRPPAGRRCAGRATTRASRRSSPTGWRSTSPRTRSGATARRSTSPRSSSGCCGRSRDSAAA